MEPHEETRLRGKIADPISDSCCRMTLKPGIVRPAGAHFDEPIKGKTGDALQPNRLRWRASLRGAGAGVGVRLDPTLFPISNGDESVKSTKTSQASRSIKRHLLPSSDQQSTTINSNNSNNNSSLKTHRSQTIPTITTTTTTTPTPIS